MDDIRKNEVNLLTLPRSDVGLPMPKDDDGSGADSKKRFPSLLLLQLPSKWKAEDLKDARFVIPKQHASLVVEHRETSFQLQRVETSNALVLVPPAALDGDSEQQQKRRKVTNKGVSLQLVQARLLQSGSGAFFLETKAVPLRLADLRSHLPVWDPYNGLHVENTPTLSTLGNSLAKSRAELVTGLRQLQAVQLDDSRYCRLAEEPRLDVLDAVLATLVEAFPHFASEGLDVSEFWTSSRVRLPKALQADETVARTLVTHCLETLTSENVRQNTTLHLDVTRVGAAVASRILTRQPVWEESLLLARWQTEMPGVETQVPTDWLRGHAVRLLEETKQKDAANNITTTKYYWKYLPAVDLVETTEGSVVWDRLVQAKPEWTTAALEPYLDAWERFTGQVPATILRHAAVRFEGDLKIYHAR
eukprot:scaffold4707_cov164-Amphora_coffeaeformis.AAC.8